MRSINYEPFVFFIINDGFEELFPNAADNPTTKTLCNGVLVAVTWRQVPPWRTCPENPEHCIYEHAVIISRFTSLTLLTRKMRRDFIPYIIGYVMSLVCWFYVVFHRESPQGFSLLYHTGVNMSTRPRVCPFLFGVIRKSVLRI